VTALAEGADRLAAEVALSLDAQVKVRLVVPIPMPIELYELDFDSLTVLETPLATSGSEPKLA
jgi:predicted phosphoribosyltransferase